MANEIQLAYLKSDLGFMRISEEQRMYLLGLLERAEKYLERERVKIAEGTPDDILVASVASWMYRTRNNADKAVLPPMIKQEIRDRRVGKIMRGDGQ